jgi:hypothetical protein
MEYTPFEFLGADEEVGDAEGEDTDVAVSSP